MDSHITEKSYTRHVSADSEDEEHALTTENSRDDEQIRAYVSEFKKEVEAKYAKSRVNAEYKFARKKRLKSKHSASSRPESFDSLEAAAFYDLDAQNVKHELLETMRGSKASETDIIVDAIKKMGKLDARYLRTQFANTKSPFFKILSASITKKLAREGSVTAKASEPIKLSARVKQKSFKVSNAPPNFQKSFNICVSQEKSETVKKIDAPMNSAKFGNKLSYFVQPAQTTEAREKKPSVLTRNYVKNKTLNSSMSPRNKTELSIISKRKNASLKQTKASKREVSGDSVKSKQQASSIVQKLKKNVIASNINISQITTTKNNIINNINCNGAGNNAKPMSRNHITLTKDQLTSLIQKNLYSKAEHAKEKRSLSKRSSSRSVKGRESTIVKRNENVFQYATARPTSKHMETLKNASKSRMQ